MRDILESGPTKVIFENPRHPYTQGLINSLPELAEKGKKIFAIPGKVPSLDEEKYKCPFYPRCSHRREECYKGPIYSIGVDKKHFVRCIGVHSINKGD